jgi:hypothetical protein
MMDARDPARRDPSLRTRRDQAATPAAWTRLFRHVRVAAQTAPRRPPSRQSLPRPTPGSWPALRHPPRCTAPGGRQRRPRTSTVGPMPNFCGQQLPLQGAWRCAWPGLGGPARCTRMDSCCEAAPSRQFCSGCCFCEGPQPGGSGIHSSRRQSILCRGPLRSAAPYGMRGPPSAPVVPTGPSHHFLLSSVNRPSPAARSGGRRSTPAPRRCLFVCVRWHRRYIRSRRTGRAECSFHGGSSACVCSLAPQVNPIRTNQTSRPSAVPMAAGAAGVWIDITDRTGTPSGSRHGRTSFDPVVCCAARCRCGSLHLPGWCPSVSTCAPGSQPHEGRVLVL